MGRQRRESSGVSAALVCLDGFQKEALQRCTEPFVISIVSRSSRHHDEIETGQRGLLMTERFADEPLQAISIDRTTRLLLGDSQAETGRAVRHRLPGQHGKSAIGYARRFLKNTLKVRRRQQARRARKATVRNGSVPVIDR